MPGQCGWSVAETERHSKNKKKREETEDDSSVMTAKETAEKKRGSVAVLQRGGEQ